MLREESLYVLCWPSVGWSFCLSVKNMKKCIKQSCLLICLSVHLPVHPSVCPSGIFFEIANINLSNKTMLMLFDSLLHELTTEEIQIATLSKRIKPKFLDSRLKEVTMVAFYVCTTRLKDQLTYI